MLFGALDSALLPSPKNKVIFLIGQTIRLNEQAWVTELHFDPPPLTHQSNIQSFVVKFSICHAIFYMSILLLKLFGFFSMLSISF